MYIKNTPNLIKSDFSDFTAYRGATVTRNKTFPIEVFKGGRNYLLNTSNEWKTRSWTNWNSVYQDYVPVEYGDRYIATVEIENTYDNPVGFRIYPYDENMKLINDYVESEFVNPGTTKTISVEFNVSKTTYKYIRFFFRASNVSDSPTIKYRKLKIEKGSTPTEYSPAPEDGYGYTGSDGAYHIQISGGDNRMKTLSPNTKLDIGNNRINKVTVHPFSNLRIVNNYGGTEYPPINETSAYYKKVVGNGVSYNAIQFWTLEIPDNLDLIASDPSIKEVSNTLEILKQSTLDKDVHTIHTSEGDFSAQVKMTTQGSLYASNAVMLEVEIRGDYRDLKREEITYTREIASEDVNSGTSETIDYGTFVVLETNYDISSEMTTLVCYDLMVKTQQEYDSELFTYPTTVHNLLLSLASACNLELDTNTYKGSNLPITSDVWVNVNYTYRDILNHIAQLTTNTIKMKGDKLHLFGYEDTGVQLNRFANLKIGEDYGPTNILNISYEPQRDNVFSPANANDIPKDERKELAFVNNPIFMGNEQSYADTLLPQLTDMTYATSEFKLYHGGIFQVGDMVEVYNGTGYVKTLITQQVLDSSNVQSEYVSSVPFSFKSEYVVETDQKREGQTTYFIVDKQNGIIEGLVNRVDEVEDETSRLTIEVGKISTEVENIHLGNIYVNSSGELGNYFGWSFPNTNTPMYVFGGLYALSSMTQFTNFEIIEDNNSLAGSKISFFGNGRATQSLVPVINDRIYSFKTTRVKGTQTLNIVVNEYDSDRNYIKNQTFPLPNNVPQEFTLSEFDSSTAFVSVEWQVSGVTLNNRLEFTETMLAIGQPKDYFVSSNNVRSWAESSITQMSDNIELKVNKDGVIGSINVSPEGLKISSGKLEFDNAVGNNVNLTGKITATSGEIGNFDIQNGVLTYETPLIERDYTQADVSEIRRIILTLNPPTPYQLYIYDLNNDGTLDILDMIRIRNYLLGTEPKPIRMIKTKIQIGTSNGEIRTTAIYGNEIQGASFVMKAERLIGTLADFSAISLDGKEIYVDENGFVKADIQT